MPLVGADRQHREVDAGGKVGPLPATHLGKGKNLGHGASYFLGQDTSLILSKEA